MGNSIKTLKFAPNLVPLVLSGYKTRTWRFFDEKNLQVGDGLSFLHAETHEPFATAEIVSIYEKKFGDIDEKDLVGHEKFSSDREMRETYRGYVGDRLNSETTVRIIDFKLIESSISHKEVL